MDLQLCYSASEDMFPLPRHIKERYGPFGLPERRDTHRPYISSNFVTGLDGRASFRELKGHAGDKEEQVKKVRFLREARQRAARPRNFRGANRADEREE